jgi:hypothetical protein
MPQNGRDRFDEFAKADCNGGLLMMVIFLSTATISTAISRCRHHTRPVRRGPVRFAEFQSISATEILEPYVLDARDTKSSVSIRPRDALAARVGLPMPMLAFKSRLPYRRSIYSMFLLSIGIF